MQAATRARSARLATSLHDNVVRWTGQRGRGTRPAEYRVLRPIETPACIIELGFLTDREEEELMVTPEWQDRAARGILDGVVAWLDQPAVPAPEISPAELATALQHLAAHRRAAYRELAPRPTRASQAPRVSRRRAPRSPPARGLRPTRRAPGGIAAAGWL
jgi:hypothetical protein